MNGIDKQKNIMKKLLPTLIILMTVISCNKEKCVTCNDTSHKDGSVRDSFTACDHDYDEAFRQAFNGTSTTDSTVIQCVDHE